MKIQVKTPDQLKSNTNYTDSDITNLKKYSGQVFEANQILAPSSPFVGHYRTTDDLIFLRHEIKILGGYSVVHPTLDDASQMWELAKATSLDTNSSYSYLMMTKFFNDRCFIVKDETKVVGFITGFVLKDDVYFVWQICVDNAYRGEGLSYLLLSNAAEELANKYNVRFIQATVSPDNKASMGLFKKLAKVKSTFFAKKKGFIEENFPDDKPEEELVQVGPLNLDY